jgi:hypothetical protein
MFSLLSFSLSPVSQNVLAGLKNAYCMDKMQLGLGLLVDVFNFIKNRKGRHPFFCLYQLFYGLLSV